MGDSLRVGVIPVVRPPGRIVQLAQSAQALAGRSATGIRTWAISLEARGQALLGCRREALIAVRSAEAVYEHFPPGATRAGGFGFHPHLMRFCQENALLFASENKINQGSQRAHLTDVLIPEANAPEGRSCSGSITTEGRPATPRHNPE